MAALVTGLIPILRTAVDATTTYKCRSMWFGILCIRLVILFLAQLPFTKLDADFSCNGTSDNICTQACYNKRFNKPMMVAWNFVFVLVVVSALIMELFTSYLRSLAVKRSSQAKADVELEARREGEAQVTPTDSRGRQVIDFHRNKGAVWIYLLSICLRILVEACFLYILFSWNLPILNSGWYKCSTQLCKQSRFCVLRASPEKRMSIYALASISGMVIVLSTLFCIYSITHYLCRF